MVGNEIAGTENRIRPASKEVQRERAIARVERTTFEDVQESIRARAEFGPSYGYATTGEWWETMQRSYDLPDDLRPEWVSDDLPVSEDPVVQFVQEYDGDFDFLRSLHKQVMRGKRLSSAQYDAAKRSMERQTVKPVETDTDDPVIQFLLAYEGNFEFLLSLRQQVKAGRTLSDRQYAGAKKCMDREKPRPAAPRVEVTEGMYRTSEGRIFKVQRAVHGSGNLYAKELLGSGDSWRFEYAQGAVRKLKIEDKLTLEQAREFGALYGTCMVCGRTLTDEVSISHGIGPICEGRMVEWI